MNSRQSEKISTVRSKPWAISGQEASRLFLESVAKKTAFALKEIIQVMVHNICGPQLAKGKVRARTSDNLTCS